MTTTVFEELILDHSHRLYDQIRNFIIMKIESGELNEGDQLPSELELCHILHISRPPIRQAFAILVEEGYMLRKKRGGTFIRSNHVITSGFDSNENYHQMKVTKRKKPYTVVLQQKKVKGTTLIKTCLEESKSSLIYLDRVRYVEGKPVARVQNFLSFRRFPIIKDLNLNNESLYLVLKKHYGIELHHVSYDIQAIVCDSSQSRLFGIEEGSPLLRVTTVAFTQNNVPFDYSIDEYIGDKYVFHIDKMHSHTCL